MFYRCNAFLIDPKINWVNLNEHKWPSWRAEFLMVEKMTIIRTDYFKLYLNVCIKNAK